EEAYRLGAVDYLVKPIVPEILRAKVAAFIELYRLRERTARDQELRIEELKRSNRELEQFAYVAAHDLQEPLRKIKIYLQLVEKRCREFLDWKTDHYIGNAVGATERLESLVKGLLAYARVGSGAQTLGPADCGAAFDQAMANLE